MTITPKYFLVLEVEFWLPVCLLLAACGLGSGGWCGCGLYRFFRLAWMMLKIVSYIDYYSVYIPDKKKNTPLRTVQLSGRSQVIGQFSLYQCKDMPGTAALHVF